MDTLQRSALSTIQKEATQRDFMPSLHQRRLWQKEAQLEREVEELNVLIARSYNSQIAAAKRIFPENKIQLLLRLRIRIPARRFWLRVLNRWAHVQRSRHFERFMQWLMRIVLWIQRNL